MNKIQHTYCIYGNIVDRNTACNGNGVTEEIAYTLNTQDRHDICFQLCGDRDNPSVSVSDKAYCLPANPMSDRGQAVCYEAVFNESGKGYWMEGFGCLRAEGENRPSRPGHIVCIAIEGNGSRPSHREGGYSEGGRMFTLNTVDRHSVCYSIDALSSNSMKSSNPYSGFHETEIAKCLDTQCLNPMCNQGGQYTICIDSEGVSI